MVKFLDLQKITQKYSIEIHEAVSRVIDSGWYLQGEENHLFEKAFADYCGTTCCVGVGNGLCNRLCKWVGCFDLDISCLYRNGGNEGR